MLLQLVAGHAAIIATNWSGPTAYLDESVGYPLRIDGLEEVAEPGAFLGHRWASPSAAHLMEVMRHVVQHPEEGRRRGRCAPATAEMIFHLTVSLAKSRRSNCARAPVACRAARQRMQERYAPEVVARDLVSHLIELQERMLLIGHRTKQEL